MIKLGLLGRDISHSRSQEIYQKLLRREIDYTLFDYPDEKEIPNIDTFFDNVQGLSITAPYKRVFLSEVHLVPEIKKLNAINCIRKTDNGYEGTNTDYLALEEILLSYKNIVDSLGVILLGDGAMATVLLELFKKLSIEHVQFSRKMTPNFEDIELTKKHFKKAGKIVVINACSRNYLFNGVIDSEIDFYDLNYSNEKQEKFFNSRPNKYTDGIELLEGQARHALTFWGIE